jgi:hypothetical protein
MTNLPPGVTESMIPGNRPEDVRADELGEALTAVWEDGWSEEDVVRLWREICREGEDIGEDRAGAV